MAPKAVVLKIEKRTNLREEYNATHCPNWVMEVPDTVVVIVGVNEGFRYALEKYAKHLGLHAFDQGKVTHLFEPAPYSGEWKIEGIDRFSKKPVSLEGTFDMNNRTIF